MNLNKIERYLACIIFFIIFITLIFNIYSLNFSYYDLGLFTNSQDIKNIDAHERYYILYLINSLFDFNKKNFGIFLIFSQYIVFFLTYLYFYQNAQNKYLSFFFLINLNFLYVIFFDFHFEFYLLGLILIFIETKKNYIKFLIILIIPFIKDIYLFISFGMYIFLYFESKINHKIYFFTFLLSIIFFILNKFEYLSKIYSDYTFNYKFLLYQFLYFLIILFPFFIFLTKKILKEKILLIGLPYLIFLFLYNDPNYFKFYNHYLLPITFILFLALNRLEITHINKKIIIFIIAIHLFLSPLIGFPFSIIFKDNNIYYKNILMINNFNFISDIKNKRNNFAYVQNNFFSPILYDYFKNVQVLDHEILKKISIGDVIILNENKNLFIGDKKCPKKNNDKTNKICNNFKNKITKELKIIYNFNNIIIYEKYQK